MPEELTRSYEPRESNGSEREVSAALRAQLLPGELLLEGVRVTDPKNGDIEADLIVLFPDAGAAVLEVKGGEVTFENGEWFTRRRNYSRRIHPIQQARGAKHALRRYLDRQPEWNHGLIRSQWFIVMPHTAVTGDLGPEGRREQLIGAGELGQIRERMRAELLATELTEELPPAGWVEDVYSLLVRGRHADATIGQSGSRSYWVSRRKWLLVGIGVLVTAAMLVTFTLQLRADVTPPIVCTPGYTPCIPVSSDVDCSDLDFAVQISGNDTYGLDRDDDGTGCES